MQATATFRVSYGGGSLSGMLEAVRELKDEKDRERLWEIIVYNSSLEFDDDNDSRNGSAEVRSIDELALFYGIVRRGNPHEVSIHVKVDAESMTATASLLNRPDDGPLGRFDFRSGRNKRLEEKFDALERQVQACRDEALSGGA